MTKPVVVVPDSSNTRKAGFFHPSTPLVIKFRKSKVKKKKKRISVIFIYKFVDFLPSLNANIHIF